MFCKNEKKRNVQRYSVKWREGETELGPSLVGGGAFAERLTKRSEEGSDSECGSKKRP